MMTTWKGDYFYIFPSISFLNDEEGLYVKFSWFKWNVGFYKKKLDNEAIKNDLVDSNKKIR